MNNMFFLALKMNDIIKKPSFMQVLKTSNKTNKIKILIKLRFLLENTCLYDFYSALFSFLLVLMKSQYFV